MSFRVDPSAPHPAFYFGWMIGLYTLLFVSRSKKCPF